MFTGVRIQSGYCQTREHLVEQRQLLLVHGDVLGILFEPGGCFEEQTLHGVGVAQRVADHRLPAERMAEVVRFLDPEVVHDERVEGIADGSSAVVKLWSGWYSDRISWRKRLAVGGYGTTIVGLGLLVAITSWPQVIIARALAWMESGYQNGVTSSVGAQGVMQLLPMTWSYVENILLGQKVPHTVDGNVQVGVAYLHHLLGEFLLVWLETFIEHPLDDVAPVHRDEFLRIGRCNGLRDGVDAGFGFLKGGK